jgi:3-deoxy-D-manno-octulosonate 8-phosphate phosphatase KdsC-like HAD superfamily phosphatase
VHITKKSGGDGAFREAVEWILIKQDRLDIVIHKLKQKIQNQ